MSILDPGSASFDKIEGSKSKIQNRKSKIQLLVFSVQPVAAAAATEFIKLKPVRRVLFILGRHVVALFALGALQNYVISRHIFSQLSVAGSRLPARIFLATDNRLLTTDDYSTISETVPAPTVRPPSRIAKRSPFSIAIGAISSISIWMLSPGMTISTPAGRCATPVTSVVLK